MAGQARPSTYSTYQHIVPQPSIRLTNRITKRKFHIGGEGCCRVFLDVLYIIYDLIALQYGWKW